MASIPLKNIYTVYPNCQQDPKEEFILPYCFLNGYHKFNIIDYHELKVDTYLLLLYCLLQHALEQHVAYIDIHMKI